MALLLLDVYPFSLEKYIPIYGVHFGFGTVLQLYVNFTKKWKKKRNVEEVAGIYRVTGLTLPLAIVAICY